MVFNHVTLLELNGFREGFDGGRDHLPETRPLTSRNVHDTALPVRFEKQLETPATGSRNCVALRDHEEPVLPQSLGELLDFLRTFG